MPGRVWPLTVLVVALELAALTRHWQQSNLALWLALGAAFLFLWQGFAVGLCGGAAGAAPSADGGVFEAAFDGQSGLGWGGFLSGSALVGLLSDLLAARGFCRGARFASFCIIAIAAPLTTVIGILTA